MKNWNVRQEDIDAYLGVCADAAINERVFDLFKSLSSYRKILEHTSVNLGYNYLNRIIKHNPDLLKNYKSFWENDKYGSPQVFEYSKGGWSVTCSPTTLQYIGVLSELMRLFNNLNGERIIEIGGGYGGQCKIINDRFKPWFYHIVDLPEVGMLQNKYLSKFGKSFEVFNQESYPIQIYDLVISNYALSEVTEPMQTKYVRDILLNAKHGYITCNGTIHAIDEIKNKFPSFKITPDIEGERKENFIITW